MDVAFPRKKEYSQSALLPLAAASASDSGTTGHAGSSSPQPETTSALAYNPILKYLLFPPQKNVENSPKSNQLLDVTKIETPEVEHKRSSAQDDAASMEDPATSRETTVISSSVDTENDQNEVQQDPDRSNQSQGFASSETPEIENEPSPVESSEDLNNENDERKNPQQFLDVTKNVNENEPINWNFLNNNEDLNDIYNEALVSKEELNTADLSLILFYSFLKTNEFLSKIGLGLDVPKVIENSLLQLSFSLSEFSKKYDEVLRFSDDLCLKEQEFELGVNPEVLYTDLYRDCENSDESCSNLLNSEPQVTFQERLVWLSKAIKFRGLEKKLLDQSKVVVNIVSLHSDLEKLNTWRFVGCARSLNSKAIHLIPSRFDVCSVVHDESEEFKKYAPKNSFFQLNRLLKYALIEEMKRYNSSRYTKKNDFVALYEQVTLGAQSLAYNSKEITALLLSSHSKKRLSDLRVDSFEPPKDPLLLPILKLISRRIDYELKRRSNIWYRTWYGVRDWLSSIFIRNEAVTFLRVLEFGFRFIDSAYDGKVSGLKKEKFLKAVSSLRTKLFTPTYEVMIKQLFIEMDQKTRDQELNKEKLEQLSVQLKNFK